MVRRCWALAGDGVVTLRCFWSIRARPAVRLAFGDFILTYGKFSTRCMLYLDRQLILSPTLIWDNVARECE